MNRELTGQEIEIAQEIFLAGLKARICGRYGFDPEGFEPQESSGIGGVLTSMSFVVNGFGWCWDIKSDSIDHLLQVIDSDFKVCREVA